jgi:beta-glucosidase-like glycosyl hydrolase
VGVDLILLYTRYDLSEMINRVEDLIATGMITEDRIDAGVRRVLTLKAKYGLLE